MRYFLTFLSLCIASYTFGQNFIDRNFEEYVDLDESTVIHVAPKSFEIAAQVIPDNTEESSKIKEIVSSITSLDLVAVEDLENANSEYKRGRSVLDRSMEQLVDVKSKDGKFGLFIDQENDIIYEIVGIGTDDDDFFVVSITGEMRLDMISEIINEVQNNAQVKNLAPFKKYDSVMFDIYPNPVSSATDLTVDIPESMVGGDAVIYDYNGKQVQSVLSINEGPINISTDGLQAGTYIVSLENEGIQLKKKVVVVK